MADIEGLDKVLQRFDELSDTRSIETSMTEIGRFIKEAAKNNAPVDTGELKESIDCEIDTSGGSVDCVLFADCDHALPVEYGTLDTRPQPFMRPAIDENRFKILEVLKEGLLND